MSRGSVKFGECAERVIKDGKAVLSEHVSVNSLSDPNCASSLIRVYPIKEVPVEAEALTDWLYQRFVEKEELLAHFYDTGLSRIPQSQWFCVKTSVNWMILQPPVEFIQHFQ